MVTIPGASAAPPNDPFESSTPVLVVPYNNSQSTDTATLQTGEPQPCGGIGGTVWYTLTAPQAGVVRVSTAGSTFDTVLAAYTGNAVNALSLLECNDDTGAAGPSVVQFNASAGAVYRIQAGGYFGVTGPLTISFVYATPPANDNFSSSAAITGSLPYSDARDTRVATTELSEPNQPCDPIDIGRTVWYSYTPAQSRLLTATTQESDFDTVLAVYTGNTLASLVNVDCSDDTGSEVYSTLEFVANAGTTYRIQASGFQADGGNLAFSLSVSTTDTDSDGYTDGNELVYIGTGTNDPCGNDGWPSDLFASTPGGFQYNTLNVQDIGSFIAPVRRMNTSPGDTNFDARWDLVPGSTVGGYIGAPDIAATFTGATGYPPMLNGQRAFGQTCPFPP
jgi:hypothetical protein